MGDRLGLKMHHQTLEGRGQTHLQRAPSVNYPSFHACLASSPMPERLLCNAKTCSFYAALHGFGSGDLELGLDDLLLRLFN